MGILIFWSTLTPPPSSKMTVSPDAKAKPEITAPAGAAVEQTENFPIGPYLFSMGSLQGGIRSLELEGEPLIRDADPGLLEIREAGQPASLPLLTQTEQAGLISEGKLGSSVVLRRKIGWDAARHANLLRLELELQNVSSDPIETRFSMAVYKPLVALHEEDKHYLAGIAWIGKKQEGIKVQPGQQRSFPAVPEWVVSQGKSEAVVIGLPRDSSGLFHVEHPQGAQAVGWIELGPIRLEPGEQRHWELPLYIGPMVLSELKKIGMEETLSFGAFSGITRALLRFLSWGERYFHNYGWSICLLSLAVWLPFAPITTFGMRMSKEMQEKMAAVKPQEARIRKEHQKNPQKMQKELMELYRKNKINPASGCIGCLPFLLTWPLYITLFQVLTRAPELRGASFFWIQDLSQPDRLIRLPASLPLIGASLNVLPFLAAIGTFVQQKAMQKPLTDLTEEQRVQQQMLKIFPLMFILIFYNLPSGFMLYWVINSVLMGGQQLLIARAPTR